MNGPYITPRDMQDRARWIVQPPIAKRVPLWRVILRGFGL